MGTHPLQELQYVLPVNCKCGYKYIVASNSFGQPRIEQISVRTFYYYQTETMKDHSEIFSDHLKFQLINEIGLICSSVRVGNVATGKFANLSSQLSCHQSSLASFRQAFNFEKHTQLPQCFYYVKSTFGGTAKQIFLAQIFPSMPIYGMIGGKYQRSLSSKFLGMTPPNFPNGP